MWNYRTSVCQSAVDERTSYSMISCLGRLRFDEERKKNNWLDVVHRNSDSIGSVSIIQLSFLHSRRHSLHSLLWNQSLGIAYYCAPGSSWLYIKQMLHLFWIHYWSGLIVHHLLLIVGCRDLTRQSLVLVFSSWKSHKWTSSQGELENI